ncbi:hypothetical protein [Candidatus Thiosymbion oneisti]|uniref:hypothetical protein n=1 Tax=Candidatus Thiosymbion oneisti TaxID=589554 RepID=UPI00114C9343|nr:hypothetical protein [Candidatus Thiosymbion oneisti]
MRNNSDRAGGGWFIPLFRGIHVILAVMLLGIIYWLPPIDIKEELRPEWTDKSRGMVTFSFAELAFAEHDKLVAEIADNAKSMYEWFQLKFIYIGTVFAGVFFNLYFRDRELKSGQKTDQNHAQVIKGSIIGPIGLGVIAISLFVCVAADLHIKDRQKGSEEVGLWIRYFIEPVFTGPLEGQWIGWEKFLRDAGDKGVEDKQVEPKNKKGELKKEIISGLHFTVEVTLFKWISLHSLTFLVFIFYVYAIQEWQLNWLDKKAKKEVEKEVLDSTMFWAVFWLIHVLILALATLFHTLPNTLLFKKVDLFTLSFTPNIGSG